MKKPKETPWGEVGYATFKRTYARPTKAEQKNGLKL